MEKLKIDYKFNLEDFKCTNITYHNSTKRVATVYFEVLDS